ncbi:hypothetical protein SK1NUM_11900 [Arachnia rubra]|nr:hypothetical protein SK1NUM_11900 [Arachnia rubra]
MSGEPKGAVDTDGTGRDEGRGKQLDDPADHDRIMHVRAHPPLPSLRLVCPVVLPVRCPGRRFLHRSRTWPRGRKARVAPVMDHRLGGSLPQLGQQFGIKFGET